MKWAIPVIVIIELESKPGIEIRLLFKLVCFYYNQ